jgi:hypothetical protein
MVSRVMARCVRRTTATNIARRRRAAVTTAFVPPPPSSVVLPRDADDSPLGPRLTKSSSRAAVAAWGGAVAFLARPSPTTYAAGRFDVNSDGVIERDELPKGEYGGDTPLNGFVRTLREVRGAARRGT